MSILLLSTKLFFPPPVKNLVIRPRLLAKLDESLSSSCRLAVVCAPAGFGKTTLVSHWVTHTKSVEGHPAPSAAWLSVDEGDNDMIVFWTYAITAIQTQKRSIGKRALTLLQASHLSNPEAILSLLVNDLVEIPDDFILILDDFHLIRTPVIHQSLSYLIEHAPSNFHVLILSRVDPPLPLALLRGRGQLLEIRLSDLRFSNKEALTYLNDHMRLTLQEGDVVTLNTKTEGWAAGLQMAGISLHGRYDASLFIQTFSGSNRYILDYLTDEILDRQPAEIQTFLMQTSILENLSAPLCDAVIDAPGASQAVLEQLERNNLFLMPLDQERRWFRYHHLFAEILRLKLSQTDPSRVPDLRKRAARWFEAHDRFEEAVFYLHAAGATQDLAFLIDGHALQLIKQGQVISLRQWVQFLPEDLSKSRPWLCILRAWSFTSRAELAEAEPWLDRAEALIRQMGTGEQPGEMLGIVYALRTEILHTRGDIAGTIEIAQSALALLDVSNLPVRASVYYSLGRAYYTAGELDRTLWVWSDFLPICQEVKIYNMYAPIESMRCNILANLGKLQEATNLYQQAIAYMIDHDIERFFIAGNLYNGLAMMAYQKNDLEQANQLATEGLKQNRPWGNLNAVCVSLAYRAQIEIALGNLDGAWADLQEISRIEKTYTPYFDACSIFLACRLRFHLAKGDWSSIEDLIRESGLRPDDPLNFPRELDHMILCRVLLAQGCYIEGDSMLQRLAEATRSGGRFGRLIEILNLRAVALHAAGKISEALLALRDSLDLAEPEGYVRTFLDLEQPMAQLLVLAAQNGIHPEYTARLLADFPTATATPATAVNFRKQNLALREPLSRRELEVLQLIATGLANKEIAHRLSISLRTVKYHSTNLYTKLDVNTRAQAIQKAFELGILE
jgi:ATP/maltotriose-dependent transcriptional regulator MalT